MPRPCGYAHQCYTGNMEFTIGLIAEIHQRLRNATWRGVWSWLTYGSGLRLIPTIALAYSSAKLIYDLFVYGL